MINTKQQKQQEPEFNSCYHVHQNQKVIVTDFLSFRFDQPSFTSSKSTIETPEQCVESVLSYQKRHQMCLYC